MREIGGYFELQHFNGCEYHVGALRFNSARYAIAYVAVTKKFRTIYLPIYLCDTVADTLRSVGINVITYPISADWLPTIAPTLSNEQAILIVNYFGQLDNNMIVAMRDRFHNVIIDNIQSFFQQPVVGVSTVYSCRKYFGVSDGAYLYTDANPEPYEMLPQDCSTERITFLAGRYEYGAQKFYSASRDNEDAIAHSGVRKMSVLTENLLRAIDYEQCIKKRKENFAVLNHHLGAYNQIVIRNYAGLFMYPLLQDSCEDLRNKLIALNIYIPKLWPLLSKPVLPQSKEACLTESIIWLPIDQRYGTDDMEYMANKIKQICGWIS